MRLPNGRREQSITAATLDEIVDEINSIEDRETLRLAIEMIYPESAELTKVLIENGSREVIATLIASDRTLDHDDFDKLLSHHDLAIVQELIRSHRDIPPTATRTPPLRQSKAQGQMTPAI